MAAAQIGFADPQKDYGFLIANTDFQVDYGSTFFDPRDYFASIGIMTVADRMVLVREEEEEAIRNPKMDRCSKRLNQGATMKPHVPRKTGGSTNCQAVGGCKKDHNEFNAKCAVYVNGYIPLIDGIGAFSARTMIGYGVQEERIIVINNDHSDTNKIVKNLHDAGYYNVYIYEGDYLKFMNLFPAPVGLTYADFTKCCPKIGSPKYDKYRNAFVSLVQKGNISEGSIFAFTHSQTPRAKTRPNVVIKQNEIIDALKTMFSEAGVTVDVTYQFEYTNTEDGGRSPMSFVVFSVVDVWF